MATPPDPIRALLEDLFATWYPLLVGHCRRLLGDHARAEDCAQQALCELHRLLIAGKSVDNPRAWSLVVARRIAFKDHQEARILTQIDLGHEMVVDHAAPVSGTREEEFPQMLAVLTPREEAVLMLRLESLKYREIAERLDITPSTVNTLLARALEKLEVWRSKPRPRPEPITTERPLPKNRGPRIQ